MVDSSFILIRQLMLGSRDHLFRCVVDGIAGGWWWVGALGDMTIRLRRLCAWVFMLVVEDLLLPV